MLGAVAGLKLKVLQTASLKDWWLTLLELSFLVFPS